MIDWWLGLACRKYGVMCFELNNQLHVILNRQFLESCTGGAKLVNVLCSVGTVADTDAKQVLSPAARAW